jgi:hypothetical protein
MSTHDDDPNNRPPKVGWSPELKHAGFFNFGPLEPPPQLPQPDRPVETDGYPPYPTLPAWPLL